MPVPETMTADQLGDLLGITSRSVRDLAARGVIQKAGKGCYPVRDAVRAYTAHLRDTAALRGGDPDTSAARRRESEARALKVELANRRALGELVDAQEVARRWTAILTDVRARMLAIPARVAGRLGREAHAVVEDEVRLALEGAADAGPDRD